ncbi:RlpA-like double-psi beta-barrel domain-containing protein [Acinetobacter pollinis]|uniref:Uncharacterized protein n=1 Tax=Acinetobacter pollinis TaxID=2605270 RepID=A0ABU6DXX9_9GAMM|nr:hypothetical protein [Acinetobacter pollinis]MEB5477742.1 hypothetical protein [Acinetobacter pollinis]
MGNCPKVSAQDISSSNNVVLVSDGLWDNRAACRRLYDMRCISTPGKKSCTRNVERVMVVGSCPNGQCIVAGKKVTMMVELLAIHLSYNLETRITQISNTYRDNQLNHFAFLKAKW